MTRHGRDPLARDPEEEILLGPRPGLAILVGEGQTRGVAAIGAGAIAGAFLLPWAKAKLGPDLTVAAGTLGTAGALALYGLARDPTVGVVASALAGASWIAVLANLNVSAQVALPNWVRGRGLALFVTVFFGTMTLGSAVWGEVASALGLPLAHFVAADGRRSGPHALHALARTCRDRKRQRRSGSGSRDR